MKHPIPEVDAEISKTGRALEEIIEMIQQIVIPVECGNCHRKTLTYNVTEQGVKLCPVCITELSHAPQFRPGPSEVKVQYGPVVSWQHDGCVVTPRWTGDCGSCDACEVKE